MAVPEASVHKNRNLPAAIDNVGLPRKLLGMKPKSDAQLRQKASNDFFRRRILTADARHEL